MVTGKTVRTPLFALVMLAMSALAGRVNENGTGAAWVAPELLDTSATSPCNQAMSPRIEDLQFEWLDPASIDEDAAQPVLLRSVRLSDWEVAPGELRQPVPTGVAAGELALTRKAIPAWAHCNLR